MSDQQLESVEYKAEQNLVWYIKKFVLPGEALFGMEGFEGHTFKDTNVVPRYTVLVTNQGGDLSGDGVDKLSVLVIVVSNLKELAKHAARVGAIRGIFSPDQMEDVETALNAPANGPDLRPAKNFAFSCMGFDSVTGHADAREKDKELWGTSIPFEMYAGLI